ncbi:AraC family transcriptional regulator [Neptunomonas antarctica]|uniref:AraC-type DNA-binding protein n=1 Tax=Neptunomonas antarctica TaxID=619304 RepID=A0A1N7M4C6_9GAMM|nr:AraC family transcriptional regulator [Neptunomonas antarctica]SIS80801.1 AraC-type DNA-binding protein [Neptunomonas antarctica]
MNAINQLLDSLKIEANVYNNGQFCGDWAIDTSGSRQMTFHVVSKGKCFFKFEGEAIELSEGDAVFMPSDTQHCVTNLLNGTPAANQIEALPMTKSLEEESTGLVCGHFTHRHPIFEKLVAQMPKLIVVRHSDHGATRRIIELILEEAQTSGQHTNVLLNRLADCLFYLLVRGSLDTATGVFASFTHPQLSAAMELIHQQRSGQRLSLDDLASAASMSRSAFSSLFKEVVQQTPMDYLTQWRMTQAYRALADEGITTLDAALSCGYESESSFAKAFKRVMGVGPGHVRAGTEEVQV